MSMLLLVPFGCFISGDKLWEAEDPDGDEHAWTEDCDNSDGSVLVPGEWYVDVDGDGYGTGTPFSACEQPSGTAVVGGDCDDASAETYPGAAPQDSAEACMKDADGDGYGDAAPSTSGVAIGTDCDDAAAAVYPDAPEICDDGLLNDCNGSIAEAREACVPLGRLDMSTADSKLYGVEASGYAGREVEGIGDVDGDGVGEILVSADTSNGGGESSGEVFVISGGALRELHPLDDHLARYVGEAEDDRASYGLVGLGSSGDTEYLAIGAFNNDTAAYDAGATYIVAVEQGSWSLGLSYATYYGETATASSGATLAALGIANSEGPPGLLIGADSEDPGEPFHAGAAYLVLAPQPGERSLSEADAKLIGAEESSDAGRSVAALDFDGDGRVDYVVGAPSEDAGVNNRGAVHLVLGPVGGEFRLSSSHAVWRGVNEGDGVGRVLARLGDLNDDGFEDLAIGVDNFEYEQVSNTGLVCIALGHAEVRGDSSTIQECDAHVVGTVQNQEVGQAVQGAFDADRDGALDLLIGGVGDGTGDTVAYLFYNLPLDGSTVMAEDAHVRFLAESDDSTSVLGLGVLPDLSGDGGPTLLLGVPPDSEVEPRAGAVFAFHWEGL
ncbi:MAG: FG-GAP repeat protein [Alphaproteobacteria bacterium]|nr:FG-GAP repeat protein [Alphaproteobacteria bacterium]